MQYLLAYLPDVFRETAAYLAQTPWRTPQDGSFWQLSSRQPSFERHQCL